MATTIHSALQYIKFEFAHKRIQQKIDKLDPQKDNFHSKAQNASKEISRLYAKISSTNPLQDSTCIQTLAYLLDKKVSSSKLTDFEKNLFSANLQRSANSRFLTLDEKIIGEIVKHLRDKDDLVALAQVNKYLNLQINKFCLKLIKFELNNSSEKKHKTEIRKIEKKYAQRILKKNFQSILSQTENLTNEELKNKILLYRVFESVIKINKKITAKPKLFSEFSFFTNNLIYNFEIKLEKAPESLKAELSKKLFQSFPIRFSYLPQDVLSEIFNHLDLYSLNKLKETCKCFHAIIKNKKSYKDKLITYITLKIEQTNLLINKLNMSILTEELFNILLKNEGYDSFDENVNSGREKIKKLEMTVKKYEQFLLKEKQQN